MRSKLHIFIWSLVILSLIFINVFSVKAYAESLPDSNVTNRPSNETGDSTNVGPPILTGYQIDPQEKCLQEDYKTQPPLGMKIAADKGEYQPGQRLSLFVSVLDSAGCNIPALVKVDIVKIVKNGEPASTNDSQYYYTGYRPYNTIIQDAGEYVIKVSLVSTSLNEGKSLGASTIFKSVNFYETISARILIIAIVSFLGLMIVTGLSNRQKNRDGLEILRFAFISGIIFSVIGSFVYLVDEVGTNSPVGLIRMNPGNGYSPLNGEWVINIGGDIRGPFNQEQNRLIGDRGPFNQEQNGIGIQIPLYVIIFGIIGGYLRYLYSKALPILTNIKSSKKDDNILNLKEDEKQPQPLHSFYLSLGEIALLFLAPVLAVAMYFILTIFGMSGPNSVYTIGAFSIAIGLVTKEVIDVIIKFAKSKLGQAEDEIKKPKGDVTSTNGATETDKTATNGATETDKTATND